MQLKLLSDAQFSHLANSWVPYSPDYVKTKVFLIDTCPELVILFLFARQLTHDNPHSTPPTSTYSYTLTLDCTLSWYSYLIVLNKHILVSLGKFGPCAASEIRGWGWIATSKHWREGLTLKGEGEGGQSVVVPSPDHCRLASALQSIATTPEGWTHKNCLHFSPQPIIGILTQSNTHNTSLFLGTSMRILALWALHTFHPTKHLRTSPLSTWDISMQWSSTTLARW